MWWSGGPIVPLPDGLTIAHGLDTTKGRSGAPIFKYFPTASPDQQYMIAAVHVAGEIDFNTAVRINKSMLEWISANLR
jgi:V8-like Glu-specific endopeptidase